MLALLAPGQGSQSAGMLLPWLSLPRAVDDLTTWSQAAGIDLIHLGTEGSDAEIRDTAVAQPLLVAAALLSGRALLGDATPDVVCGHSVGELAALALAGVLTDVEAVELAADRGRVMAAAATTRKTGMAALLGGTEAVAPEGLELATVNVAGQVVVGGDVAALEALVASPPAGIRVRRLDVAGAFHTSAMESAVPDFTDVVRRLKPRTPRCTVVANADGAVLTDGRELLDRLVGQLTSPVRFDLCLATLKALGITQVVDLAPGGTLGPLVKRALPGVAITALRTPADLGVAAA